MAKNGADTVRIVVGVGRTPFAHTHTQNAFNEAIRLTILKQRTCVLEALLWLYSHNKISHIMVVLTVDETFEPVVGLADELRDVHAASYFFFFYSFYQYTYLCFFFFFSFRFCSTERV